MSKCVDLGLARLLLSVEIIMEPVPKRALPPGRLPAIVLLCLCVAQLCSAQKTEASAATPVQTIFVIPSSHWDLGFLRPPEQEMAAIKPHLDSVIQACADDPQFRWTIESVWQLKAWLDRTNDPALIERMGALLRSGQIELSAADGSMHTEFMGSEELDRLIYAARKAGSRFGIQPRVAMMNDAPGFSSRLPQMLARSGVRYFITGSNTAFGGGTALWPGRMPIYWEGQDGSKVLMWQTQGKDGGYTEGMATYYLAPSVEDPYLHTKFYPKEWTGLPDLEITRRGIDKLLQQYRDAGYQHSVAAVLFMHDGIGPDYELKGLLPNVRAWNAAGKLPHLVVGTPSEFFAYLEQHDGGNFPTYKGDWSGLWAHVKLNSPGMSADARSLQDQLPQAETVWSLLRMEGLDADYPAAELAADYQKLFVYDEHNGAGQGGWPKVMTREEVLEQNEQYSSALRSASVSVKGLLTDGLMKLTSASGSRSVGSGSGQTIVVFNPLSWTASHLVRLQGMKGSFVIRDLSTGALIPSQRLALGDLCFEARDVPSIGYRSYAIEPAPIPAAANDKANQAAELELNSPFFKVEIDPFTGTIARITDLRWHRVIVDKTEGGKAGELQTTPDVQQSIRRLSPTISHDRGPVIDEVIVERPQSLWPRTVIALPQSEPTVQITESLDRSRMPFVPYRSQGINSSFAFRFSLPGEMQRWVENGSSLYRFPQDLLPGAKNDAAVPRHVLVWSGHFGDAEYSVMLSQRQAFFDDFERAGDHPKTTIVNGTDVEAMTKSDQSETADRGVISFDTFEPHYPAKYDFSFAIRGSGGPPDATSAYRYGVQDEYQAIALPAGVSPAQPSASLLSLSAPNVIVLDLKPSVDGQPDHFMMRLQEVDGKTTRLRLRLAVPIASIAETSLTEDHILRSGVSADNLVLTPHETLTLRLTMSRATRPAFGESQ
jgi:Glycosyl hydrolases family 38 N-terminal domain